MDNQEIMNDGYELSSRAMFDGFSTGWNQVQEMVKSVDMQAIVSVLASFVALVTSQEAWQAVGNGISKELLAIKHPIDSALVDVGSSTCPTVKKLFGLDYEQLKGEREPDVDQLTLVYKTRDFNRTYNITTAARDLLEACEGKAPQKLVIYAHGFTDDPSKTSFTNISDAFLSLDEADRMAVLALDGSPLIRWLYLRSSTYVAYMGQKLAEVMVSMHHNGLEPEHMHLVGHSLGAHICGFAGKQFFELTGKKVGRITALDPAGPCFTSIDPRLRVYYTDAAFVEVIHSDMGVYGLNEVVGHADYFPNSGAQQPECLLQTCSHSRAWQLYAESVLAPRSFPAARCDSWTTFKRNQCTDEISYMGYGSTPDTRGTFYLQTEGHAPFGKGEAGAKYCNNLGLVRNVHEEVIGRVPLVRDLPILG